MYTHYLISLTPIILGPSVEIWNFLILLIPVGAVIGLLR